MEIEDYNKRNKKVDIFLMQHIPKGIICENGTCANTYETTIMLRHKTLCKDGKYRSSRGNLIYCAISLLVIWKKGKSVQFSETEMKDLEKVYNDCVNNKIIPDIITRNNWIYDVN